MDPALINTEEELEVVGEDPVSFNEGNRGPGRLRDFSVDIVVVGHILRPGSHRALWVLQDYPTGLWERDGLAYLQLLFHPACYRTIHS